MQDNRFQSTLVTVLAIGFGAASAFAISSQTAQGYPVGVAVSYGANPVWSAGGVITGDGIALVIEVPSQPDAALSGRSRPGRHRVGLGGYAHRCVSISSLIDNISSTDSAVMSVSRKLSEGM